MFGIGGFELFLILLFGFLIFGPDKLPAMAKTLGKAINKFRTAQQEMSQVIKTEVYDPTSDEPFKNPLDVMEKTAKAGKDAVSKASSAASSAAKTVSSASTGSVTPKQESFSERKARYDRERAAKRAADEEKRKAAIAAEAAAMAGAKKVEAATDAKPATPAAAPAAAKPAASPAPAATAQPADTNEKGE